MHLRYLTVDVYDTFKVVPKVYDPTGGSQYADFKYLRLIGCKYNFRHVSEVIGCWHQDIFRRVQCYIMFCEQGIQVSQPLKLVRQKEQREDSGTARRGALGRATWPCCSRIKPHGTGWENNGQRK